jgi:hypothetical protein
MKRTIIFFLFASTISILKAQDYPAAEQKWTSHHTLMAAGRATGKRTPEIAKKLRKDYNIVVKNDRQVRKYSKQYNRQLDKAYKKEDHSARWVLRHKTQLNTSKS